ncbi:hypothetical protein ACFVP3_11380 [Streptomyces sp. NPDC057806]|uniref:hypothetical protein n=1 Tax=unclassified Streptomyces TaxID=2593676 RepID=UPI0036A86F4E
MPLQPAQRPMAALLTLVAVATVVCLTVPAALTPVWALIGLIGVVAVLIGVQRHRPAHRRPWWVLAAGTPNRDGLPIVEVPLADPNDLDAAGRFLWDEGIHVTLAAHPLVPRARVGFRVQVTALDSDDDIDRLDATLTRLAGRHPLRTRGARAEAQGPVRP